MVKPENRPNYEKYLKAKGEEKKRQEKRKRTSLEEQSPPSLGSRRLWRTRGPKGAAIQRKITNSRRSQCKEEAKRKVRKEIKKSLLGPE